MDQEQQLKKRSKAIEEDDEDEGVDGGGEVTIKVELSTELSPSEVKLENDEEIGSN